MLILNPHTNQKVEKILNSKGDPIFLNALESRRAEFSQKHLNALGHEINVTTLTTIVKKVVEQKFFMVRPSDYVDVVVGQGAWGTNLTTFREYDASDDFDAGIVGGGKNVRLSEVDAGIDSINVPIMNWVKKSEWTLFDLEHASKTGVWDIVTAKAKARKRNWDLGIQKIAFLGGGSSKVKGLLTQTGVTIDTTTIPKPLSTMTGAELKLFCSKILAAFRANSARTVFPNRFVMPESDFLGIAAPSSADFPLKSVKQVLEETFSTMTGFSDFKILPLAYADLVANFGGKQRYALYHKEEDSIRMDIPVDFTMTVANSINGFTWENAAYGQFTGVQAYRPLEIMYFDVTPVA